MQLKALILIAMLAGHEAARIHTARRSIARTDSPKDAEKAFQQLNSECEWSISKLGCSGDGCAWRRLSNDWPPPSSQSCRRTDQYMLENNGAANLKIAVGVLAAKSKKYNTKCQGATIFNRYCARRQQQMMRAMKLISKAEAHPDVMNGLSAADKAHQKQLFDASLSNVAGTMGEDGQLVLDLAVKMKGDAATKRDPKAAVQKIMQLLSALSFGSEEQKEDARENIRNYEAAAELSREEAEQADRNNGMLAEQLGSETVALDQALDHFDTISADEIEDEDDGSVKIGNGTVTASMLQVLSKGLGANVIAFILLSVLVVTVVIWTVVEVIATIVSWAFLAVLGCGAYTIGHDHAVAETSNENPLAKKGLTGFAKCFFKVFAYPFILVGKATVATYEFFSGNAKQSALQVAANSTTFFEALDSDKLVPRHRASASILAHQ